MILAPEPFDVLLGRGKPIQKRPGNKLLRLLIDQNSQRYNKAPRLEKRAIANEIVQGIKSNNGKFPGRFLRLCGSTEQQGWKQVSDAVAIDKVSHCFRARRKKSAQKSSWIMETSAVDDDDISHRYEKYAFTTPTTLGPRQEPLFNPQDCQQEGQPAHSQPASVTTTSIQHTTSVAIMPLLKTPSSPFYYSIHAASNSSLIIGAGRHDFSDMMWTLPCQKMTRAELPPEEPCHGEKGINKELPLAEDSAADGDAAARRLTHYHY